MQMYKWVIFIEAYLIYYTLILTTLKLLIVFSESYFQLQFFNSGGIVSYQLVNQVLSYNFYLKNNVISANKHQ